jgi:polyhydroxyalkanoate synthesis regulator phasin
MKEQLATMGEDEIAEFEEKLEKMSDLLQEDGDLNYDAEEHYTIFD